MKKLIILIISLFQIYGLLGQMEIEGQLIIIDTDSNDSTVIEFKDSKLLAQMNDEWYSLTEAAIDSAISNGDGTFSLYFGHGDVFTSDDLTGPKGDRGDQGLQGVQGVKGDKGDQGDSLWSLTGNKISYSSGHVGIGVSDPGRELHVIGQARIGIGSGNYTEIGHGGNNGFINTVGEGNLNFAHDNHTMMSLMSNGKVLIGDVETPGEYGLYVENGVLTEEVKVALKSEEDWSDDAFDRKPSLEMIEKTIKEKSHLLGMPSAKELVRDGYSVTEMDAKLLEQIEWLTLHILELNKNNRMLNQELEQLKLQVKKGK